MDSAHIMNEVNYLKYQGRFKGFLGWIFSTDHKRIGFSIFILWLLCFQ